MATGVLPYLVCHRLAASGPAWSWESLRGLLHTQKFQQTTAWCSSAVPHRLHTGTRRPSGKEATCSTGSSCRCWGEAACLLGPCLAHTTANVSKRDIIKQQWISSERQNSHSNWWFILEENSFGKAYENLVSNKDAAAEINLVFEATPNSSTLGAKKHKLEPLIWAVYFSENTWHRIP